MSDYVIVGGGSAGAVVLDRLSADPAVSVTLLEAGGIPKKTEVNIPAAFGKLFKTELDWDFATVPQPRLKDRELYWPRGRALGGSSNLNAQMWIRGHRADYDSWAANGCEGWAYDDVLPFFQRAERRSPDAGDGHHGVSGPLHLQDLRDPNPTTRAFLAACEELGMRRLTHHNTGDHEGFAQTVVTQRRGRRWSSYDAYIKPAMSRSNVTVVMGALVDKVKFDGTRAVAVEYLDTTGSRQEVRAQREVILSAGAIGTPSVLLRSGIGAPEQLATLGIELVAPSPEVGQNLQDHLACGLIFASTQAVTLAGAEKKAEVLKYLARRRGLLTSNVGEAAAFIRSTPEIDAPDLELVFAPVAFVDHGRGADAARQGLTIAAVLLQPMSRGSISLESPDPAANPVIDPRYLSDGSDAAVLRFGVRQAGALYSTRALAPLVGEPIEAPDDDSDSALDHFIAEQAETLYHPIGTCRMGHDSSSVVNPQLRVRGVDALRVVDVSVMPRINRGHTHAPAVMIGERAAALITRDAESRQPA